LNKQAVIFSVSLVTMSNKLLADWPFFALTTTKTTQITELCHV